MSTLKKDDKGRLVPEITVVELKVPEAGKIKVEAPKQTRFNVDPAQVLTYLVSKYGIKVNSDVPSVMEATDTKPASASYYIQGHGYITFNQNGSFYLASKKNGNRTIGSFNTDGKFELRQHTDFETGEVTASGQMLLEELVG